MAGGNVKWYSHLGKQFGNFLKGRHKLSVGLPDFTPRRNGNIDPQKDFYVNVLISIIYNGPKLKTTQLSINKQMDKNKLRFIYTHRMQFSIDKE